MIRGKNVNLRYIYEGDLGTLITLMQEVQLIGDYMNSDISSPQMLRKSFYETGFSGEQAERLLVTDHENNILGMVWHFKSVPYFDAREIGYILYARQQAKQGIMSEAVQLLVNFLFESRNINRLEIRANVANVASRALAKKCGFVEEGIARQAEFMRGKHADMAVSSMLRSEWLATFD